VLNALPEYGCYSLGRKLFVLINIKWSSAVKALAVANEALDSLFNNFLIAVRISIPVIVLIGVVIALSVYELINAYMFNAPLLPAISAVNSRIAVVWILDISVFLFGIYWIATAWHRFILLGERPGRFFPKLHLGPTWSYIWRILLTGFLLGFSLGILALIIAAVLGVESLKITIGEYGDAIARGPLHIAMLQDEQSRQNWRGGRQQNLRVIFLCLH
jgi:hypothetical protein